MNITIIVIFQLVVLLFSVMIHEISHGVMALSLGDDTAKRAGRLTLNPLKHIDPIGSILLPVMMLIITQGQGPVLGWAKPVPYNPNNLYKDYKHGPLKVALAGPLSNIGLAVIFAVLVRVLGFVLPPITVALLGIVVFINIYLAVFNLLPIPPLDGSNLLALISPGFSRAMRQMGFYGLILVLVVVFFFAQYIVLASLFVFQILVGHSAAAAFYNLLGL